MIETINLVIKEKERLEKENLFLKDQLKLMIDLIKHDRKIMTNLNKEIKTLKKKCN